MFLSNKYLELQNLIIFLCRIKNFYPIRCFGGVWLTLNDSLTNQSQLAGGRGLQVSSGSLELQQVEIIHVADFFIIILLKVLFI